jgi:hypothetical protein
VRPIWRLVGQPCGSGGTFAAALGTSASAKSASACAGLEIDDELALERLRDAQQRVDARRPAAALETSDRRLGRAAELGQLALREVLLDTARRHLVGDVGEEPAAVTGDDAFVQPVERPLHFGSRACCHCGQA